VRAAAAAVDTIGFAGLTHLGIVSSAAAASKGFRVVAYDPDADLCTAVRNGHPPVVEPGLAELLREAAPRATYWADPQALAECSVIYISADVPTDAANRGDSTPVVSLVHDVVRAASPGATLVVLSQVLPGFSRALRHEVESAPGKGLRLYYQVETLIFGRAVERALKPERWIVGCADPAQPLPSPFAAFLDAFDCPRLAMRYESAELCKISINMFLTASVTTANMLAEICEAVGAEWNEIAPALRLDRRIGPHAYLAPGLGIGGGNLTRDLTAIAAIAGKRGTDARLVEAWIADSDYRRDWVLRRLHRDVLGATREPVVAVWGVAYKAHTHETKNSPAVALLDQLAGEVTTRAYDPGAHVAAAEARRWGVAESALAACDGADALAVMTPWPQFTAVDLAAVRRRMRGGYLLDPYGCLDAAAARAAGFQYAQLGSGNGTVAAC
jgi:UDPglucose 6-dehydrogenase